MVNEMFGWVARYNRRFCRLQTVEIVRDVGESVLIRGHGKDEVFRVSSHSRGPDADGGTGGRLRCAAWGRSWERDRDEEWRRRILAASAEDF